MADTPKPPPQRSVSMSERRAHEAAQEAARPTIEDAEIIRLSAEGQERFAEALLNPPEPNEALKRVFEHHCRLVGHE
jgi:hypothetical protein